MQVKFDPILGRLRADDSGGEAPVTSVNGEVGDVVLGAEDIDIADAGGLFTATEVEGALQELGGKDVCAFWHYQVAAGTTGSLSPPAGGTLVLDWGPDGTDVLVSKAGTDSRPNWESAETAGGVRITATLDAGGNWALSGTPSAYPVHLVFLYRSPLALYDYRYSLHEVSDVDSHTHPTGDLPDDVMLKSVYDTDDNAKVEWAEGVYDTVNGLPHYGEYISRRMIGLYGYNVQWWGGNDTEIAFSFGGVSPMTMLGVSGYGGCSITVDEDHYWNECSAEPLLRFAFTHHGMGPVLVKPSNSPSFVIAPGEGFWVLSHLWGSTVIPAVGAGGGSSGDGGTTGWIEAGEYLWAGDWVNLYDDSGTLKVRKADATAEGKRAHGFVLAAVSAGSGAVLCTSGVNNQISGLTLGADYWLATTAGAETATAPTGSGNVSQRLGIALSATEIPFQPGPAVTVT